LSKKKRLLPVTQEQWDKVESFNKEITELFLEQSHLSPQSLKQYESGAKQFFRWVHDSCGNKPLYELKSRDALRYQNYLSDNGQSANAAKFKRSVVSSLCNLIEVYYADDYPTFRNIFSRAIPSPVGEPVHEKEPVTKEQLNYLIESLREQGELQMVAYIVFSYRSAARRAEVIQMTKQLVDYPKVKDKDGNEKNYYVTENIRTKGRGKDGKIRKLQFDDEARDAVLAWLEQRSEDSIDELFVRRFKDGRVEPLQASTFNEWCSGKFSEILNRRIYPHVWRVSRASHMVVDEGKDIKAVQALLGHESSETSEIYVVRDNSSDLDSAFE
jgi:integrase